VRLLSTNSNTDNSIKNTSSVQPTASPSTSTEDMKKRLEKIQRVVLVESKEIKSLKEKNADLQKQINKLNENYDKLFDFLSKSRNNN